MEVYLTKIQIKDTPTTKTEVFIFNVFSSFGAKKVETEKEPEWWKTFKTEQEAINHLKN